MHRFRDAFISYGRKDSKAFTGWLCDRLIAAGLDAWYDQNDIPLGVDYQNQIDEGIAKADNFLFVISPHSIHSVYCRKEIDLAVKLRKRIIPLLHVGEISREIWQHRNPGGTDAEWLAYQEKGLHSSFVKEMHPVIEKINWVYFQEGVDDTEAGFSGLIDIFQRQRRYVRQHTLLLHAAMEWERHHRSSRYLLIGEDRKAAENWLGMRFETEQPPCEPTDLHCEYIGESIKNANNLMTQVFLCAASGDGAIADQIRKSLLRESITVWANQFDVNSGENLEATVNRGIEGADQVVYLVSPESSQDQTCQRELAYAMALRKRVVPIQVDLLDREPAAQQSRLVSSLLPPELQGVQPIDLTRSQDPLQYQKAIAQLLQELNKDTAYYEQHKLLLVKALKWQAQNQNPSVLLRGYNLERAKAWLTTARTRAQHRPIPLLESFVEESQKLPPNRTLEVFISYSRVDSDFARKLNDALQTQGKTTWFDQESIASGADFQQEIYRGIECAENFLFILSPSAVRSPYCADEVEYARQRNKRIITVLHRPLKSTEMPPTLASIQWIDFNAHQGDFYANFNELVRTLDTDREHVHQHAQWWLRATEWEQQQRNPDLLLRGSEYAIASVWLEKAETEQKQPPVTDLHRQYLQQSQGAIAAARRRETTRLWILRGMLAGMTVAFLLVFRFWRQAQTVQEGQINAVSRYARVLLTNNQQISALVEAIRAARLLEGQRVSQDTQNHVRNSLRNALVQINQTNSQDAHDFGITSVQYSPDGTLVATTGADGRANLWRSTGELVKTLEGHKGEVFGLSFSPDGQTLVTSGRDGTLRFWDREGNGLRTLDVKRGTLYDVEYSPDGRAIATAGADGTVRLWNQDGTALQVLEGHTGGVNGVTFSPDGQLLASSSGDSTIKLWSRSGTLVRTITGHTARVNDVIFSPNGQLLASASDDQTARLWNLDGTAYNALLGHRDWVNSVRFSPDGQRLVTASNDRMLKVWNLEGQELNTLRGHQQTISEAVFDPTGEALVSGSYDGILKFWQIPPFEITTLRGHQDGVHSVHHSRDGRIRLTGSDDGHILLWDAQGNVLRRLTVGQPVRDVALHPSGQLVATANEDGITQIWNLEGALVQTLGPHNLSVSSVSFSADGQHLATASIDKTARLWNLDGTLLTTLSDHLDELTDVQFSPDGTAIATTSFDNTVRLWDYEGQLLTTLSHQVPVWGVAFSPDGQTLVTGTDLSQALVWSRSGELLATLQHNESIVSVAFSPDGRFLATGGWDNRITIWTPAGNQLQVLEGHRAFVRDLDFSPNGLSLASASEDQTTRLWNLDVDTLQNFASLWSQDNTRQLLTPACRWVSDFLEHSREVSEEDRNLCRGINP